MREHPLPTWECQNCRIHNDEDLVTCRVCNFPRPGTESYADQSEDDLEFEPSTQRFR